VKPVVDLAPGAEHDPLAQMFAELVRENVRDDRSRRNFDRLRASVGVVADDSGSALTLRFDFGRLTVHEGLVGIPTVIRARPRTSRRWRICRHLGAAACPDWSTATGGRRSWRWRARCASAV
jgi:hypothetical protein